MQKNLLENPVVVQFLMESPFYEVLDDLMETYGIDATRQRELYDVTDAVVEGKLVLAELPTMVEQAFGLPAEQAQKLAIDLAGHRLLPLELFLPGVSEQITTWGGDPSTYPEEKLTKTELGPEEIVKRLVNSLLDVHKVELPEAMKNRLRFLLQGYLSGERDEEATKKMLMRGENIGGMALTEEVAGGVLAQVKEIRGSVDVVDEGHEETSIAARKVLGEDVQIEKHVIEGSFVTADGRKEVKGGDSEVSKVAKGTEEKEVVVEVTATSENPKSQITKDEQTPNLDLETQKPVSKPAKTSALPAKSVTHALAKEVPVISGSVLKDHEKEEVDQHVYIAKPQQKTEKDKQYQAAAEDAYGQLGGVIRGKRMKKAEFLGMAIAHIRGLKDPLRTEEQLGSKHGFTPEQIDRVITVLESVRMAVQGQSEERQPPTAPSWEGGEIAQKEKQVLDQRHAALTQKVSKENIEPVMPNARVSAARSKDEELTRQSNKIDQAAVQHAESASKPKKAKVKVSQPSAPAPKEGRVVDVQYKKRLVGPVEQLGTMRTDEFRRLSSDAMQAIQKILDQLEVLKEEDYGQYIEGVKAWRKSPMNQLYVQMTQEALMQGVALTEVASQRRNKGEESLSPSEVQALMQLNGKLAF